MITTASNTLIATSKWCNRVHETTVFRRPGLRDQIHIATFIASPGDADLRLEHTTVLRVGPAREVAAALLAAVAACEAPIADEAHS